MGFTKIKIKTANKNTHKYTRDSKFSIYLDLDSSKYTEKTLFFMQVIIDANMEFFIQCEKGDKGKPMLHFCDATTRDDKGSYKCHRVEEITMKDNKKEIILNFKGTTNGDVAQYVMSTLKKLKKKYN